MMRGVGVYKRRSGDTRHQPLGCTRTNTGGGLGRAKLRIAVRDLTKS